MLRRWFARFRRRPSLQRQIGALVRQLPPAPELGQRVEARVLRVFMALFAAGFGVLPGALMGAAGWPVLGAIAEFVGVAVLAIPIWRGASIGRWVVDVEGLHVSHWSRSGMDDFPCQARLRVLLWAHEPYNYFRLYGELTSGATRQERRELRWLCEAATLELLRLDVHGVRRAHLTDEARLRLDTDFGAAKALLRAINEAVAARRAERSAEKALKKRMAQVDLVQTKAEALMALESRHPCELTESAVDRVRDLDLEAERRRGLAHFLEHYPG